MHPWRSGCRSRPRFDEAAVEPERRERVDGGVEGRSGNEEVDITEGTQRGILVERVREDGALEGSIRDGRRIERGRTLDQESFEADVERELVFVPLVQGVDLRGRQHERTLLDGCERVAGDAFAADTGEQLFALFGLDDNARVEGRG